MDEADLRALSIRELRQRCTDHGVSTAGLLEKADLVEALLRVEATPAVVEAAAESDPNAADETIPEASDDADDDEEEEEEDMLAQALLMSQESEASLASLSIRELRERCGARDISTRGMTSKAELVAALFGDDADEADSPAPARTMAASEPTGESAVQVLASFGVRFACFAAADVPGLPGAAALEQTGKVLLPRSCLAGLAFLSNLPTMMLLRLSLQERTCYCGVADFVDDAVAFDMASAAGFSMPRWGPGGAGVAAVFVPRWVRSQLALTSDSTIGLALVSLPKASGLALQPHTDAFAAALGACTDPRAVLTELMNRYVAVAVGDVIHLRVPGARGTSSAAAPPAAAPPSADAAAEAADDPMLTGEEAGQDAGQDAGADATAEAGASGAAGDRFALDVVSLRGLPGTRCMQSDCF